MTCCDSRSDVEIAWYELYTGGYIMEFSKEIRLKRILYIYNTYNTFVQVDKEILEKRYDVISVYVKNRSLSLFTDMWKYTRDVDLVVAWFASWHSFPGFVSAALRRKPRILITGGYDVAYEPEISYGLRLGGMPQLISDMVFRLTTQALPFSETSFHETLKNTPLTEDKTKLIRLGVPDNPIFEHVVTKQPTVFTVSALNATSIVRKGIDIFVESAKHLPEVRFVVVGKGSDGSVDNLKEKASPNVEFTGFLSDEDLADLRCKAKVYVQVSKHEGFGLAVAEAMLAKCIPVVSERGSLPEVVGDEGIYTEREPDAVAKAIEKALQMDESMGEYARQRILKKFPMEQRAEQLYAKIDMS